MSLCFLVPSQFSFSRTGIIFCDAIAFGSVAVGGSDQAGASIGTPVNGRVRLRFFVMARAPWKGTRSPQRLEPGELSEDFVARESCDLRGEYHGRVHRDRALRIWAWNWDRPCVGSITIENV
jgi:hypothetical protein